MRRRRGMRRDVDKQHGHYVDIHEPKTIYVSVLIIILSCFDAFFTLLLLQKGIAYEANPVMKVLIETDNATLFVLAKTAITAACIIFLVAHKHFWIIRNRVRTHAALFAALVAYVCLINYEVILLSA